MSFKVVKSYKLKDKNKVLWSIEESLNNPMGSKEINNQYHEFAVYKHDFQTGDRKLCSKDLSSPNACMDYIANNTGNKLHKNESVYEITELET